MKRFHTRRRDLSISTTLLILGLLAAIAGCGYAVRTYSRAARGEARGSLFERGSFAALAPTVTAQTTPPTIPPRRITPRPLRTTNTATNLVRGYIAVAVGRSARAEGSGGIYAREVEGKEIYLPAVTVYLQDVSMGTRSEEVRTDLSGRFTIRAPRSSRYRLCWRSKIYGDGCLKGIFNAGHEPLFLSTVLIPIARRGGFVASFGNVRFEDHSLPRTMDPLSNINSFAVVTLVDSGGNTLAEVPVNNFGDYLLPYLPAKDQVELRTTIENAKSSQTIRPQAYTRFPRLVRYHLTIGNTPPRLDAIVPVSSGSGKRVQVGTPGDTVILNAATRDKDGDAVEVTWSESANGGVLSSKSGPQVKWTLPTTPGRYSVDAMASDRKGGYDRYKVRLSVGTPGVPFGGVVLGTDGTLIDKARVEVNGKVAATDTQGRFLSYVPEAERYVFNIRKEGYGFYSKIYDRSVAGGRWTLTRATVSTVDPRTEIRIQDRRDRRNCRGADSSYINWNEGPALRQVWYQDGKGNNVPPPNRTREKGRVILPFDKQQDKQGDCGPGIGIVIPPNALQTSSGGAPTGNATVSLATVDLATPEQMPGDDSVERPGDPGWMQSYGAGSVELRDSTGQRLQLRPGMEAEVTIPVDRTQLAAGAPLSPTMPLLRYDEGQGIWREDGVLTLNAAKTSYAAKVKQFSSLNTDVVFTNPSCVRVQSTILPTYDLEVTIPLTGGAAPKVKKVTITDAPPHVIYNLPNDTDITLVAIAPGSGSTPPRSLGIFVVNTGPPHAGGFGTPPPASACATEVTLSEQTFPTAPTAGGEFLHGLFAFAGTVINEADIGTSGTISDDLNTATDNYYAQIDPAGDRETFTEFRDKNGFTSAPGFHLCGGLICEDVDTEINVTFANSGDLGFGRDMHCRRSPTTSGFDYACYVTNYGDITTDDAILDAPNAASNTGPIATVAMEYSKINAADADSDRHVKFYVYVGETRVNNADLDGNGRRPIPQLCMVCHGGAYPGGGTIGVPSFNTPASVRLGARFLPFDLRFYSFAPSPDKVTQQSAFKKLNQDIVRFAPQLPAPDPIGEIIDEMYAGAVTNQHEEFVVPGWRQPTLPNTVAQEQFYRRVMGNVCRTCHQSQPFANVSAQRAGVDLTFRTARDFLRNQDITGGGTFSPFSGAEQRVCSEHVMPHALRTHDIFWGQFWPNYFGAFSPTIASQFQAFGDTIKALPRPAGWPAPEPWPPVWNGQICGPYTGAGSAPPSFYSAFVHPLWSRNYGSGAPSGCATCHGPLSGNASATHNALLVTGLFGSPVVIPNDVPNSLLTKKLAGTAPGSRMPDGCPSASVRCLNEAGGVYNPAADPNPATTTTEVDRIKFWINGGAPP